MKHLRQYIRHLLKESKEEAAKIMELWDLDEWEQAKELAYMMGPEVSRHPDLKIWYIMNAENGDVAVSDVNYDQAMDPKYQAFVGWRSGYSRTVYPDRKNNPWGDTINAASAREHPPSQLDFDEAADNLREEGLKVKVKEVDDEELAISVELVPV